MPRKARRIRDPLRSHARVAVPKPQQLRETHHGKRMTSGKGWVRSTLRAEEREALVEMLRKLLPVGGVAWRRHSGEGMQANDLPMVQRTFKGTTSPWYRTCSRVVERDEGACPRCGRDVHEHRIGGGVDVNVVHPGAALWPHIDLVEGYCDVQMLILLQPAVYGGEFRVGAAEGLEAVNWKEVKDSARMKRRARDSVSLFMCAPGDMCVLDSTEYVHEVTRVQGAQARVTLSVGLKCPAARTDRGVEAGSESFHN
jgi:hypothetical protein